MYACMHVYICTHRSSTWFHNFFKSVLQLLCHVKKTLSLKLITSSELKISLTPFHGRHQIPLTS